MHLPAQRAPKNPLLARGAKSAGIMKPRRETSARNCIGTHGALSARAHPVALGSRTLLRTTCNDGAFGKQGSDCTPEEFPHFAAQRLEKGHELAEPSLCSMSVVSAPSPRQLRYGSVLPAESSTPAPAPTFSLHSLPGPAPTFSFSLHLLPAPAPTFSLGCSSHSFASA